MQTTGQQISQYKTKTGQHALICPPA